MKIVKKYEYIKLERKDTENGRLYVAPDNTELSSVTTILDKTKSEETKKALASWRKSIGEKRATEIVEEAAFRGTLMHGYLERYLLGENPKAGTNVYHKQSHKMAGIILENYLQPYLDETWGTECTLYFPELYAGTCDLIGVYKGKPSILDFKQSNKLKDDKKVEDYFVQLSAYILAQDILHGTNIEQGVILMCTKDFEPQTWTLSGDKLSKYKNIWWNKVAEYYNIHQ